jgi:hypothetical protein
MSAEIRPRSLISSPCASAQVRTLVLLMHPRVCGTALFGDRGAFGVARCRDTVPGLLPDVIRKSADQLCRGRGLRVRCSGVLFIQPTSPLPASRGPVPGPGGGLGNHEGRQGTPIRASPRAWPVQKEHKGPPQRRRGLALITSHLVIVAQAVRPVPRHRHGDSAGPGPRARRDRPGSMPAACERFRLAKCRFRAWSRNFAVSGHTASRHPRTSHASGPAGVPPPTVPGTFVSSLR